VTDRFGSFEDRKASIFLNIEGFEPWSREVMEQIRNLMPQWRVLYHSSIEYRVRCMRVRRYLFVNPSVVKASSTLTEGFMPRFES
jgi:hypothetical protein